MAIEQYSGEVIVVGAADTSSNFKVWLREDARADLASDLRWLCGEYMDCHVVLDLADLESLEAASWKLMLDLQGLVEESEYRFVLCGLSPHVKWQLNCVRLSRKFDTFDSRETALVALSPEDRG